MDNIGQQSSLTHLQRQVQIIKFMIYITLIITYYEENFYQ